MKGHPIIRLIACSFLALLLGVTIGFQAKEACAESPKKFGLVTGLGGLGDKAFNDMQHAGMVLAKAKYGIDFAIDSPGSHIENTEIIERLILDQGCTVIFGGGFQMAEPLQAAAKAHPTTHFILLDRSLGEYAPNLTSVTFRQNEGSFLAGALAAHMSKKGKIGFLGATEIPVIRDFFAGYRAGAKHVSPGITVEEHYIGIMQGDFNPFMSPLKARNMALDIFNSGVDILFTAAAGSNKGVFTAAQELQKYAIGVDADQDHMAPGYVLTSVMKRLDHAILLMVEKCLSGDLQPGNYNLGLAEGGISLSPMTFTHSIIPEEVLATIEELKASIINGQIQVPAALQ